MNRWSWAAGVLVLAALGSGWLAWNTRTGSSGSDERPRADYVLMDFEMVSLDKQGQEQVTLRAPRLSRESGDESLDIQDPTFLLPDGNNQHWTLTARHGWVSADADQLLLRGEVEGRSPQQGRMPDTRINTDTLTVLPDQHLARTDAAVQLSQPGLVQTGVGMELDTTTRNLRLLSQVKTRYEPAAAR